MMHTFLSLWIWFEIGVIAVLGSVLQAFVWCVTFPWDRCRWISGRLFRYYGVAAIKLAPLWRFRVMGSYPKRLCRPTVVISNHVSHLDCFLISHLPWEMKWLGKASLFKIPFIGWSMRLAGDISLKRGVADSIEQAMICCASYLQRGMPVCIFPEGTRSTTASLLPFKDGAFRLAIETGADILPLAVAGTQRALPKNCWKFSPARAWLKVGQPIETQGLDQRAVEILKLRARHQIEAMLQEIRPLASV